MNKNTNDYIAVYRAALEQGGIQTAYEHLLKYVMTLKAHCEKVFPDKYSFGNVSPGYMDFTYSPFFDADLRSKKLRFGIVLNHKKMRFELWLMGQNAGVQKEYWNLLKETKWNQGQSTMPKYSVLETVLVETPDFNDSDALSLKIEQATMAVIDEISNYIPK